MAQTWSILMEVALRAAVLGLAVAMLLAIWRRRSPTVTHGMWVAVVLGMLMLPMMTALAPRLVLEVPDVAVPDAAEPGTPVSESTWTTTPTTVAARQRLESPSWPAILAGVYIVITGLMLLSLAQGGSRLRRLNQTARKIEDPSLRVLANELLPTRRVILASSPSVRVPITTGFLRPRVFLPENFRSWPTDKLRAVLAHELSHVRRGDFLWIILAEFNKCFYWFHPLAWIARRRLGAVAEEASDADAARQVGSRTAYARALVEVAALMKEQVKGQSRRLTPGLLAVPMASSDELTRRVESVLTSPEPRTVSRRVRLGAALLLALLVALSGTLELVAQSEAVATLPDDAALLDDAAGPGQLVAALEHVDPAVRRHAARELGELPHPRGISDAGIEALVATFDDPDGSVRAAVAWSLGDIRVRRAVPQLIEAMKHDGDARVRAMAAEALGEVRAATAENALAEVAAGDTSPHVRDRARYGLREVQEHGY